jgi:hypothetical protein
MTEVHETRSKRLDVPRMLRRALTMVDEGVSREAWGEAK